MEEMDEFLALCNELEREDSTPEPPAPPKKRQPIELTLAQKRVVLNYVLTDPGKGLFEDCESLWDGVPDTDEAYPALRDAVDDYVARIRHRLLGEIAYGEEQQRMVQQQYCKHEKSSLYGPGRTPPRRKCDDCGAFFMKE